MQQLSLRENRSPSSLYAHQRHALVALAQVLLELEQAEAARRLGTLAHRQRNLPAPTYTRLFGVDAPLRRLQAWLADPGGPRFVSIEGMGDLGKTALAHAAVQASLPMADWADLAWISVADQPFYRWRAQTDPAPLDPERILEQVAWQLGLEEIAALPAASRRAALQARLSRDLYLVVVDDLEPAHRPHELVASLLPLAGATRFLLTTRQRLSDLPGGTNLPLRELPRRPSLALLRQEVAERGLEPIPNPLLEQVYAVVGGNPLALKLVVGQAASLPMARVLEGLRAVEGSPASDLFRHIYLQSWHLLAPDARQTLVAMALLSSRGATYAELQTATALPPARLDPALRQLVTHSLLNLDPTPPGRYTVHRLTHTFLLNHVFALGEGSP